MTRDPRIGLAIIVIAALGLRAALWIGTDFPGIADPNHYYNLAARVVAGHGFTNDYIWQYSGDPDALIHPEAHWMPLTAALAAAPMVIFGVSPRAALIPFVLFGALLPVIAYLGTRRISALSDAALFAAGAAAFMPELVLNSLRTDTTLPFALFASGALWCMTRGTRRAWIAAGVLTGVAYLTRNDGLLLVPTALVVLFFSSFNTESAETQRNAEKGRNFNTESAETRRKTEKGGDFNTEDTETRRKTEKGEGFNAASISLPTPQRFSPFSSVSLRPHPHRESRAFRLSLVTRYSSLVTLFIVPLRLFIPFVIAALIVVAPWLARNLAETGALGSPETRSMWFFTHHDDHYAYGRTFTLDTLLAAQSPAQIIGKRAFEMAAALVMMLRAFGDVLAVAVIGGIALIVFMRTNSSASGERWWARLRPILPALICLGGAFVAYTVFLPYKAQAGSFKKVFLGVVPLLLPLAGIALARALPDVRVRRGAMGLILAVLAINALQLVRTDAAASAAYLEQVRVAADVARTLPDPNGDGAIILMTQDPYIVRYVGFQSIIYPYEDRDTIAAAAARYGVDYLLMPPNRPSLNAISDGTDADPRFVRRVAVAGTPFAFYEFVP
jgi:hypothetical protein